MRKAIILAALTSALISCVAVRTAAPKPADIFFDRLSALCGKSFVGQFISGNDDDADFAKANLQAHVRECSPQEVQIAFDVGEDRSRTWIITRIATGLRLKHRHRLKGGSKGPILQYGGDTATAGTASRQEFPVDEFSKAMFTKDGRSVSNTNIWAFEIEPRRTLVYELARPGRLFRVSFDLEKPTATAN